MSGKNSQARKELQILYGCRDMLTCIESNRLTYHHCKVKREHGGLSTVDNGALLASMTHEWLHTLEHSDIDLFLLVNECLELYKKCLDLGRQDLIDQYQTEVSPQAIKTINGRRRRK